MGIDAVIDGRNFWTGAGESQHYTVLSNSGKVNDKQYSSTSEMRTDYNSNIGNRDGLTLEQIENKIKTSVSLADENTLSGRYSINESGLIANERGTYGGVTTKFFSGGVANRALSSKIVIAPGVKGYDLLVRNMVFKHEFMHAWHAFSGFSGYQQFTERASSAYSYAYSKYYGLNWLLKGYKNALGPYPSSYSWRNFGKIVPLWIK